MTSGPPLADPARFSLIDESNIGDHYYLEAGDKCLFLFEYTSGKGYSFSATNGLINNLKKKPSKKNTSPNEYRYKGQAIGQCAYWFSQGLNPEWLAKATLVPVPPSKAKGDPEYDDRMLQVCGGIPVQFKIDVRELVIQRQTIRAAHECASGERPSIDEIAANYAINEAVAAPEPSMIGIIDDVLTTGSHFKAMQRVLKARFPRAPIVGIFVARRVFPNDRLAAFDDIDF